MDNIMSYIVHSYLFGIAFLCVGIYALWITIKYPLPNNRTSPLQENTSGIIFGIGSIILGGGIIIAKIFYGW